jgi:serine/threonine protein kinase
MEEIAQHLAVCESCVRRLDELPGGTLAENLRLSVDQECDELDSAEVDSDLDLTKLAPSSHFQLGFDEYEILARLGETEFAACFLARDEDDDLFAIKIPFAKKMTSEHHVNLFLRDASAAYGLNHPNIQKVESFGFWQEGVPFIATPYIESTSLTQIAKNARLANSDVLVSLFLQTCEAIQYCHNREMLHRHLTPNNIFVRDDRTVLVTDFCIHYDGRYQFDLTEPLLHPDPFVSPELANNNPDFIDVRSDIFSLGKILKLLVRLTNSITDAQALALKRIHTKCTRPRRRDRFQIVGDLMDEIRQAI